MAVYNVDAINENLESKKNDSLIDSLEEACDYMMESLSFFDEGARQKYIENLGKQQDTIKREIERKNANLSATTSGSAAHKKISDEIKDLRDKYDSLADKASAYSAKVGRKLGMTTNTDGSYRDDPGEGFTEKDRFGGYSHNKREYRYSDEENKEDADIIDNKRNINKAIEKSKNDKNFKTNSADLGEYNRYKTGSYRQPLMSHETGSKAKFNHDFGLDKQKDDPMASKKPGSVLAAQEKKRAIKETCLYILSVLDEI